MGSCIHPHLVHLYVLCNVIRSSGLNGRGSFFDSLIRIYGLRDRELRSMLPMAGMGEEYEEDHHLRLCGHNPHLRIGRGHPQIRIFGLER